MRDTRNFASYEIYIEKEIPPTCTNTNARYKSPKLHFEYFMMGKYWLMFLFNQGYFLFYKVIYS